MVNDNVFTDQQLIALIKEGNHVAFSTLHHRYFSNLFQSAYNVLHDKEACMDIVQEVFAWFWEHRTKHQMTSLKGYLLMAIKYQAANYIRNGKIRQNYVLSQVEQITVNDENLELLELKSIVERFTQELPTKSQVIFRMSREQNLSNKEIANKLGISEKTVSGQLARALKKLKGELGKMNFWLHFFM